ncbi:MAG: hypothetical protein RSB41_00580 [Bacilli bacterium]
MKKIKIQNMDGTMEEMDLIKSFGVKELDKDFMIFTKGEKIKDGVSKVYVSEVVEESAEVYKLIGIADEDTWEKVKIAMKQIVQGGK